MKSNSYIINPILWSLNLLFPKECISCGKSLSYQNRDYLCPDCSRFLFWTGGIICEKCGRPLAGDIIPPVICPTCRKFPPVFDRARSALILEEAGQEFMLAFKYQQAPYLSAPAGRWLARAGREYYAWSDYDLIVPVPLHHRKKRERGFNQSELLARRLSRLTRLPLAGRKFVRCRYTRTQTRLNPKEREKNVKGAFRVTDDKYFRERRLLLIDDVLTTGATVNECARVLIKAGAGRVDVLTLARAI